MLNRTEEKLEIIRKSDEQQKWVVGKEIDDALIEKIAVRIIEDVYDESCKNDNYEWFHSYEGVVFIKQILKEELLNDKNG